MRGSFVAANSTPARHSKRLRKESPMPADADTHEFPIAVLATITTGVMLCESFDQVHEAATFVLGWPVYTHHLGDKSLWLHMRDVVLAQCPGLPVRVPSGLDREGCAAEVA